MTIHGILQFFDAFRNKRENRSMLAQEILASSKASASNTSKPSVEDRRENPLRRLQERRETHCKTYMDTRKNFGRRRSFGRRATDNVEESNLRSTGTSR
jgi:hypothetical protein